MALPQETELNIPEYRVFTCTERPYVVEGRARRMGRIGLSHLIAVVPSFDAPNDRYFSLAEESDRVTIQRLHKVADNMASLFEVSVSGQDATALEELNATIENMEVLANAWRKPKEFLNLLYR